MNKYQTSASLFLDTRKIKSNGKFPLKLTIYHRPKKKRYDIKIDLIKEDWQKINKNNLRDSSLKELKMKANAILELANKALDQLDEFSFQGFESVFFKKSDVEINLSLKSHFDEYQKILESEGREGTRSSYNTTFNSLNAFKKNLKITDINKDFLMQYEQYMVKSGKSASTIGIYLRTLRAIVNRAIENGVLNKENYPFKAYTIPTSRNVKKTLSDDQIKQLLNYTPKIDSHKKALDFWIFSYLSNGINFTDILHLTPENIHDDFLFYTRRKTIRTKKKNSRPIKVPLTSRSLKIISTWKSKPENKYLFPVLEEGLTPKAKKYKIQDFIKKVNEGMDEIREELSIETKVGTYVARHTFSSRMMRQGAPTHFIKDCLGHSSVAVTENYLGDFSDSVKHTYASSLESF